MELEAIMSAIQELNTKINFIKDRVESTDYGWVKKVHFDEKISEIKNTLSEIKGSCAK